LATDLGTGCRDAGAALESAFGRLTPIATRRAPVNAVPTPDGSISLSGITVPALR
jgi:hypothetical protein